MPGRFTRLTCGHSGKFTSSSKLDTPKSPAARRDWHASRWAGLPHLRESGANHSFLSPRKTLACGRTAVTVLRRLGLTKLPLISTT